MVYRQPFPGPGLGVRCLGAITRDRLAALREADAILREEFDRSRPDSEGLAVLHRRAGHPLHRRARRQARTFDWPVIIRAVNTVDAMTATVPELPYEVLEPHHLPHPRRGARRVTACCTISRRKPTGHDRVGITDKTRKALKTLGS